MNLLMNHCVTGVLVALCASHAQAATVYTYDELNRLTRVVYDDGLTISYRYDAAGNLLESIKEAAAQPVVGGKLNDTGITANQCYAAGSDVLVSCASPAARALNAQQDGMVGRDVSDPGGADGKLGFAYELVGNHAKTECVRDKVTGLVWEGKPTTGLRAAANTYTNYGDGREGDASAYVAAVNSQGLCGFSDWRLPNRHELLGLVDYGAAANVPAIDLSWFPGGQSGGYWSDSRFPGNRFIAWRVVFEAGSNLSMLGGNTPHHVRLVR